ncbi:MAG TPA: CCA tRNA nucleotidyltransferase [Methyloceanibacter sp.]|nr:CCA tRNA nucleotidyltransferase [Methyloceanibacter sp.]
MPEHAAKRAAALPSLKDAEWLKRPETLRVFAALSGPDVETRAVGGAVRNGLLGQAVAEVDLATTALPEQVMALTRKAGLKAVPTGIEHGTVTVIADGKPFEVTTLRRDVETFGRHATVAFTEDWEEDARRRDFTLNALYAASDGTVFDPLGGYDDLLAGRVRFIGNAEARIKEDYLHILRFFRFNAYYGKDAFDAEGLHAAVRLRAGLEHLSAERVSAELKRLLVAPQAVRGIEALFDYGLLTALLGGVPRLERFKRVAAIETAVGREADAMVRLAALGVFVAEDAERLAARLRLSNAEQAVLALGARGHAEDGLPDEAAAKRAFYRLGPVDFAASVLLAWADSGAAPDDASWRTALDLPKRWQAPAFPLRGADIVAMGDIEGPEIGVILRRLEADWAEGGFALSREELLARAEALSRKSPRQVR